MACLTCPYLENYELLWDDRASGRICVKLWCCAGPELQVREGRPSTGASLPPAPSRAVTVIVDEYFEDVSVLYERAAALQRTLAT